MTTYAYQGWKRNEILQKFSPTKPKLLGRLGFHIGKYMLLTNKAPINQNKTEIHKSIGITTMYYRFQSHCGIIKFYLNNNRNASSIKHGAVIWMKNNKYVWFFGFQFSGTKSKRMSTKKINMYVNFTQS